MYNVINDLPLKVSFSKGLIGVSFSLFKELNGVWIPTIDSISGMDENTVNLPINDMLVKENPQQILQSQF